VSARTPETRTGLWELAAAFGRCPLLFCHMLDNTPGMNRMIWTSWTQKKEIGLINDMNKGRYAASAIGGGGYHAWQGLRGHESNPVLRDPWVQNLNLGL